MTRTEILNALIKKHGYTSYLEVGIAGGENFEAIEVEDKVSVDIAGEPTYRMTSDTFFDMIDEGTTYDLIFIDGDHSEAQATRDIENALMHISPEGMVVAHDACPSNEAMTADVDPGGAWMGGVWKVIARLRTDKGLSVTTVDADCGVAIIHFGEQTRLNGVREPLSYDFLDKNRKRVLNLVSVEEFLKSL